MSFTLHTYVIPRCTSSMQIDGKLLKLLVMLQMSQHKPSEKFPSKVRLHCAPVSSGDNNAEQDIARKSMQVSVSDGGRIRFPHLLTNRNALNALNQYPSMSMRWFTLPAFRFRLQQTSTNLSGSDLLIGGQLAAFHFKLRTHFVSFLAHCFPTSFPFPLWHHLYKCE